MTWVSNKKMRKIAAELGFGCWSPSATARSRTTIVRESPEISLPQVDPMPAARKFLRAMNRAEHIVSRDSGAGGLEP
jgi:hypothetical protein